MRLKSIYLFMLSVMLAPALVAFGVMPQPSLRITPTVSPSASAPVETPAAVESEGQPELIKGEFTYSNDFVFETYYVEHAVALLDLTGFVLRDEEWELPVDSQVLGYLKLNEEENSGSYFLHLPMKPAGMYNDVDHDGKQEKGLQIFVIGYSPNLYGDPFSVGDDRSLGWPSYMASVKTDPENHNEIIGGKLIIWAPDDEQEFSTDFGPDGLLFTKDDPVGAVKSGYSVIDLDKKPFAVSRAAEQNLPLYEPADIVIKDFSEETYSEAFKKMFEIVRKEYAFNGIKDKAPKWDQLYKEILPKVEEAEKNKDAKAYFMALKEFTYAFKDGHVGISGGSLDDEVFQSIISGGYGLAIRELDDGKVIVIYVLEGGPAAKAGIKVGAEVTKFNDEPIGTAIGKVKPYAAPFSTAFSERYQQARYLLRGKVGDQISLTFKNPNEPEQTATLKAVAERDSFSFTSIYRGYDPNALPVEFRLLDSGVGYVKINSNYDDLNLVIRLFERALKTFEANEVPGIIIDLRQNSGGSPLGLAGFLTDQEILMGQLEYYSEKSGKFEPEGPREKVWPNENQYRFSRMALLVGQACASACEIEAYGFSQVPGMIVVGEYPTGGVEAEVARGQFMLPEGISLQVPTGRFTLPDGKLFLEGVGVVPTVRVPITAGNVLSEEDVILKTAEEEVLKPAGAGVKPSGSPTVASLKDAEAAFTKGTVAVLEEKARESYDKLSQAGETYTYTIALTKSEPLMWMYAWCAKSKTLLDKNMAATKLKFLLDGKEVALNKFVSLSDTFSGQYCQLYYALLDEWPAGEHKLITEVTFSEAINDGMDEYPAGTHTYQYNVYVAE